MLIRIPDELGPKQGILYYGHDLKITITSNDKECLEYSKPYTKTDDDDVTTYIESLPGKEFEITMERIFPPPNSKKKKIHHGALYVDFCLERSQDAFCTALFQETMDLPSIPPTYRWGEFKNIEIVNRSFTKSFQFQNPAAQRVSRRSLAEPQVPEIVTTSIRILCYTVKKWRRLKPIPKTDELELDIVMFEDRASITGAIEHRSQSKLYLLTSIIS